jgi:hypothetical protein
MVTRGQALARRWMRRLVILQAFQTPRHGAARLIFQALVKTTKIKNRSIFQDKFPIARKEPSYVVLDPPRLGFRQLAALFNGSNVSRLSSTAHTLNVSKWLSAKLNPHEKRPYE